MSGGPWVPGQSGNLAGRPPKPRALTALLQAAGDEEIAGVSKKARLTANLYAGLIEGRIQFVKADGKPGRVLTIKEPNDWLGLVKFLYGQLDGPPKQEFDVTSGDLPIQQIVVTMPAPPAEDGA